MSIDQANQCRAVRVLIVDDNFDTARTTAMLLELNGHQAEIVTDSTKCLSQLDSFNPDVLLLDIAMPAISGYDLAEQIRSQAKFQNLPIIAISGYADAEHARQSIAAGCNQHLAKPVNFRALNDIVVQLKAARELNERTPIHVEAVPLMTHEREAVLKRLGQIAVAIGHPRRTVKQLAALIRERAELERKLAAPAGYR